MINRQMDKIRETPARKRARDVDRCRHQYIIVEIPGAG